MSGQVFEFDEGKVDAVFAAIDQSQFPGAVAGIAVNGKPVYRKGFGLASMDLPVTLSPSIRLRIASTSKHFTCFAYMLLCEEGRAGIDDPIGRHLPELHGVSHGATMRQLMTSTSGLRDAYDIFAQFNDTLAHFAGPAQSTSSADIFSFYRGIDGVNAPPGTTWIYNNGGWLLLTLAIERITGQTLEQVMRERIFEPIGMHDSEVCRGDTAFVRNRASQHVLARNGKFERRYWGLENLAGAGAIISTVDDMLRWMANMSNPIVGNAQTWSIMTAPQILQNGTSTNYGLGLMLTPYRGLKVVHHAGNAFGGFAQMLKIPELDVDIVVMTNRQDVLAPLLVNEILDACVQGLDPVQKPGESVLATGTFRSAKSNRVIQLFARDGRQMVSIGGNEAEVAPDETGVLWPTGLMDNWKHGITLRGERAQPSSIQFSDFGNVDDLDPVSAAVHPDIGEIAGRYRSEQIGTEITISKAGGDSSLNARGRFGSVAFQLECLGKGIWRTKVAGLPWLGGILCFEDDASGFRYSNFLTRSLPFLRCS